MPANLELLVFAGTICLSDSSGFLSPPKRLQPWDTVGEAWGQSSRLTAHLVNLLIYIYH